MKEISVIAARNAAEAGRLLQEHPQSVLMAGGTDLLVLKKLKLIAPKVIVTLKPVPGVSAIRPELEGGLAIGALATLDEVATHPLVRQRAPLLARAASAVASPQVRNKATLGGNLCLNSRCWFFNRSPFWRAGFPECRKASGGDKCYVVPRSRKGCFALQSGDTAAPLVVLGARLRLASARGERVVDIEAFYPGDGIRYLGLKAGEVLTEDPSASAGPGRRLCQVPAPGQHGLRDVHSRGGPSGGRKGGADRRGLRGQPAPAGASGRKDAGRGGAGGRGCPENGGRGAPGLLRPRAG